eukprot:2264167-Prymnesium_polylepis.2
MISGTASDSKTPIPGSSFGGSGSVAAATSEDGRLRTDASSSSVRRQTAGCICDMSGSVVLVSATCIPAIITSVRARSASPSAIARRLCDIACSALAVESTQ